MKTLTSALIHWLGVEVVQQVMRAAVAVSAHHHQGNEGGQENGGQHPNGHDHHRLHGDSGCHGGCRRQLVRRRNRVQSGLSDSSAMDECSSAEGRRIGGFNLIGWQQTGETWHYHNTRGYIFAVSHFSWSTMHFQAPVVLSVYKCGTPTTYIQSWSLSGHIRKRVPSVCTSYAVLRTKCLLHRDFLLNRGNQDRQISTYQPVTKSATSRTTWT